MAKATVEVRAGICGFVTRITAVGDAEGMVNLAVASDCPNVQSLAKDLAQVDPTTLLGGRAGQGAVYAAAVRHPLHQACPVPAGILKAVEVAAGFALPCNAIIKVERGEE